MAGPHPSSRPGSPPLSRYFNLYIYNASPRSIRTFSILAFALNSASATTREREREWRNSIHGRSSSSASGSATGLFWWVLPPLAPSLQNSTSASQKRMLRIPLTCRGCAAR
ncbi:hypothetical protein CKAN_01493000 [Cinnamomum micranthum f. kanehirae]|uniref:Uncharacterized protein n=1 Tax=Cinnamomum micranthum f. kanehirae TaxID=337451 RepID=A0A443P5M2_9MAGN|nr:hypothetical protein CKAN_01493000 [Cinnamomum micranthum f. kanehirae]